VFLYFVSMELEAEIEFNELLIKQCDMLLDTRRNRHRPDLAVPASRKKLEFLREREELRRQAQKEAA
jgi:hypothetical protein